MSKDNLQCDNDYDQIDSQESLDQILNDVMHSVEYAISTNGQDYDIANVFFNLYNHKYVCSHVKKNIWYECVYTKNEKQWIIMREPEVDFRKRIRADVFREFMKKCMEYQEKTETLTTEEEIEKNRQTVNNIMAILNKCKNRQTVNKIIKEAADIFYDPNFIYEKKTIPILSSK